MDSELLKRARAALQSMQKSGSLAKNAFNPMGPQGSPPMDPAAAGGAGGPPPMDPAAMAAGGGAPPMPPQGGDPAMAAPPPGGMPMDPAMAGGGGAPMDPAMMDPAMAGGGAPPPGGEVVQVNLNDLMMLFQQVAGSGGGAPAGAAPAPAGDPAAAGAVPAGAPAPGAEGAAPKKGKGGKDQEVLGAISELNNNITHLIAFMTGVQSAGGGDVAAMGGPAPAGEAEAPPTKQAELWDSHYHEPRQVTPAKPAAQLETAPKTASMRRNPQVLSRIIANLKSEK